MSTPTLLAPDAELSPSEWLRRFAMTRMKFGGDDRERLLAVANVLRSTEITRDALEAHLELIAVTIKGPAEPGAVWGWDDLPELIAALVEKVGRPGDAVH